MHVLALVTSTLFDDRFLWPEGFPVRINQHGSRSVSVEINFADARPDLIDTFMGQFPTTPFFLFPSSASAPTVDRELIAQIMIVDIRVDLSVFVSSDVLPHLDHTNIKES